jgi:hypothetical protein
MPLVFAQSAAPSATAPQSEFEAVSIHMVDPHAAEDASRSSIGSFPTNLFTMRGVPLTFLVQFAYNIESADYIAAMPGWMESQEYDVSAKVEGDQQLTLEQMRPMLQRLLNQRFHLAFHRETKMSSGFELIIAKGGPKVRIIRHWRVDEDSFRFVLHARHRLRSMTVLQQHRIPEVHGRVLRQCARNALPVPSDVLCRPALRERRCPLQLIALTRGPEATPN